MIYDEDQYRVCQMCQKPLKAIGKDRKNGKVTKYGYEGDWAERKMHKKCYKEYKKFELHKFKLKFDKHY
jgi:hypothetical protein